jgi:hypothetical protein
VVTVVGDQDVADVVVAHDPGGRGDRLVDAELDGVGGHYLPH